MSPWIRTSLYTICKLFHVSSRNTLYTELGSEVFLGRNRTEEVVTCLYYLVSLQEYLSSSPIRTSMKLIRSTWTPSKDWILRRNCTGWSWTLSRYGHKCFCYYWANCFKQINLITWRLGLPSLTHVDITRVDCRLRVAYLPRSLVLKQRVCNHDNRLSF